MTLGRKGDGQRHGSTESSGAESWRSTDTVKGPFGNFQGVRGGSMRVKTDKKLQLEADNAVSPGTLPTPQSASAHPAPANGRTNIAPWESPTSNPDATPQQSPRNPTIPRINQHPPSGSPWDQEQQMTQMPSSVFGNFLNDSSDNLGQISPGFAPPGGMGFPDMSDDRRPSVASATTVSSTGSRGSIPSRAKKKLNSFFGEDYGSTLNTNSNSGDGATRHNSEASSMQNLPTFAPGMGGAAASRNRNNSMNDAIFRGSEPPSPSSSRPRSPGPQPSSEVTPWAYQDPENHHHPSSTSSSQQTNNGHRPSKHHHRLHLPGHRHNKSSDEKPSSGIGFPLRPSTSREQSFSSQRRDTVQSQQTLRPRNKSPTPSMQSGSSRLTESHRSPNQPGNTKRSLLDRFTGRHKNDKGGADNVGQGGSTLSLQSTSAAKSSRRPEPSISEQGGKRGKLPFKSKRGDTVTGNQTPQLPMKDPNKHEGDKAHALWLLDTDMSQMEGIVDNKQPLQTPPAQGVNEIYTGCTGEQPVNKEPETEDDAAGTWVAPDSWASKKVNDVNVQRLGEIDDEVGVARDDIDPGPMYFMRVFRADSTFAVINAALNTSTAELISMMAKKTFLQDELDNYQIVMRKQDTSRVLEPNERPLVIQKRLLELAGYRDQDRLEDLGREDHGYLCRFTFLPSKMSGYSSLERDPGFNKMQRFNHIDLSGRNLITIPITLYQRSNEIITLNLSRNLNLDIPKDFIQSCSQLREIRFNSNEAWRLPGSLSLSQRLSQLDISNNKLEQLDHAELWRLSGLVSLKVPNNRLTSIPSYFGEYKAMRSLNLSSNMLTEFPGALRELTTLVDLDVSFNLISNLDDVGSFVNLERLWATNNKLSGPFDDSFKELVKLREIDARFNNITNIDIVSELPKLETLMMGHNSVSTFEGSFSKLKVLFLNHNPVTKFDFTDAVPSLSVLNMASAKLSQLPDALFTKMSGLTKLTINKNHFVSLSGHIGQLSKLEYLSIAKNDLNRLPAEIGKLQELRYLDVRENNLGSLPSELWFAKRLETLNVSSNVLTDFPKPATAPPYASAASSVTSDATTPNPAISSPDFEELGKLEDFQLRRPSQASQGMLSVSSSPSSGTTSRKGSLAPSLGTVHKPGQMMSRQNTSGSVAGSIGTITPTVTRKDSTLSSRLAATFSLSLRHLFLADNRLEDDVFNELAMLPELRILNVSYNQLYDIPPRTIRRWVHLTELYLSGNELSSLPSEDLEETSSLKVLHINANKFQTLPAELGKVGKLAILDVGSNNLKYNVSNWPYDWNWNWNQQLRYLNMSGNKRLEIKPSTNNNLSGREAKDLTDFSCLTNLRVLGLMDVTLNVTLRSNSVPEQAPDRRVRTAGSILGTSMPYGMADTLGRNEHLSTLDMVVPRFRGHEDETLFGLFDGQSLSSGGSRVAKYLHEKFKHYFISELDNLKSAETVQDALRRTYLGLNKELATAAVQAIDAREHPTSALVHRGSISGPELGHDDIYSGSVATVMYLHQQELYMSNVGDAQAILIQSEGTHRMITQKHDPAEASERRRIREAGGYVSRQGKLNDQLEVSRAFGYVQLTPCIIAAPHVTQVTIKEGDEMILLASRELWDYLTPDFAVDVARSERGDLMCAAQKLRDLAIAFGATGKIMVMMVGVSDLRRRDKRAQYRTPSMSMGPSGSPDDYFTPQRKTKRGRDNVGDSKLARLDQEVEAPTGLVTLVFTDIKNSTMMWETYPVAMQSAIRLHNELMRRQLRIIGGYEVKTEGDAFMVAFPTVTSALLWCFKIQVELLEVAWPQEILNSVHGEEVQDADGNLIFRGLSVRMGIHWGPPVCEIDPVTKRMDYFGPMVNRAARIESVADGGQICVSSDFIAEVQRLLESSYETDRTNSTGSEETLNEDLMSQTIRRELRSLSSWGFEVKDLGQRTLKGLENPEYVYLMYPHSLAGRLVVQQQKAEAETRAAEEAKQAGRRNAPLSVDTGNVWDLWSVSLRLEMLCSCLENADGVCRLKSPETALLERTKQREGEVTDRFLVNFVEHQISRIETCITTLSVRNMVRPFRDGMVSQACPMSEILGDVASQLEELRTFKEQVDFSMAPS
ncbi:PP2C-domain-containing protein [Polychaeton citri CBS 116435]|uniref:Adenylate cyclase n=1 Tax=Polychaeton citri CBS 116435 TaxID=1314669 RepID=A0A9P4QD68_9PEZI|nr:PP2C-domain-containing protein [Polychaeton citri CBS 116435]